MYVPPVRISAERAPPQRRPREERQPASKSGGDMLPGPR
jgi:hypothetical protein